MPPQQQPQQGPQGIFTPQGVMGQQGSMAIPMGMQMSGGPSGPGNGGAQTPGPPGGPMGMSMPKFPGGQQGQMMVMPVMLGGQQGFVPQAVFPNGAPCGSDQGSFGPQQGFAPKPDGSPMMQPPPQQQQQQQQQQQPGQQQPGQQQQGQHHQQGPPMFRNHGRHRGDQGPRSTGNGKPQPGYRDRGDRSDHRGGGGGGGDMDR